MPKMQEHIFGDVQDVRYAENAGAYFRRCNNATKSATYLLLRVSSQDFLSTHSPYRYKLW
jgi:hypothetical protein